MLPGDSISSTPRILSSTTTMCCNGVVGLEVGVAVVEGVVIRLFDPRCAGGLCIGLPPGEGEFDALSNLSTNAHFIHCVMKRRYLDVMHVLLVFNIYIYICIVANRFIDDANDTYLNTVAISIRGPIE